MPILANIDVKYQVTLPVLANTGDLKNIIAALTGLQNKGKSVIFETHDHLWCQAPMVIDTPPLSSLHYCTTVSLPIITVTAASRSIEIHIVLTRNTFDIIPPTPAPIAKNRMIPKKWHALIRDDLS